MATDRQIEANRRNASKSSGPKTEEGKARSRANATKHGLAGVLPGLEAVPSAEFLERRAKWANGQEPTDEAARWALDRAVAASLRVERCEQSFEGVVALDRQRARLSWDEDRAVEAEAIAARLGREPALACRRLQTTLAGVEWLIVAWLELLDTLESGGDWSEAEASKALDLLGIPLDRRGGSDPPETPGLAEAHRGLALEEVERLEALRDEAMAPLDELEQTLAIGGHRALLSKPARLILRYERDAWRRYRESTRPASQTPTPPPPPPTLPAPKTLPTVIDRPARPSPTPPARSIEDERRALREEIAACGVEIPPWSGPPPADDEDSAWLDEMERRIEAGGPSTPRRDGTNPISSADGPTTSLAVSPP